jgi:putative transposase
MARPLRIEYEGAHYHVTTRGNERKAIFRDDIDRRKFIELVAGAVEQFDLRIHAYVLMDNHYHLMVESGQTGLSRALRYLNGVYTQSINRRHKRAGHLFQGRYKAILVEKESYLLELSRYIHLNPWRVKSSIDPMKYPWSSLGYYLGTRTVPPWFTVTEVLSRFGKKGKQGYREFIEEGIRQGIRTPWEDIRGQAVMGSEEFIKEAVSRHCAGRGKKANEQALCGKRKEGENCPPAGAGSVPARSDSGNGGKILWYHRRGDSAPGMALHRGTLCGDLFNEALWVYGAAGDRGACRAPFQLRGQRPPANGRQPEPHAGANAQSVGRPI